MTDKQIEKGSKVKVHYVGTLEDGSEFDSSRKRNEPLAFTFGVNQMIAGFEENLSGMKEGEKKKFTLEPEKAYGNHDPKKVLTINKQELESKGISNPEEGMMLMAGNVPGKIVSVTDTEVKIDFNHELAGKKLTFDVEVVSVE